MKHFLYLAETANLFTRGEFNKKNHTDVMPWTATTDGYL